MNIPSASQLPNLAELKASGVLDVRAAIVAEPDAPSEASETAAE